MATEFKLPDVGEGIESGTVVGVLVSVGDTIEEDQPVLELETDKAVVEVPSSVSGTVKEIKVSENDEVAIGDVVLTIGEPDEDGDEDADGDDAEASADEDSGEDSDDSADESDSQEDSDDADEDDESSSDDADESSKDETSESVDEEEEDIQEAADADDAEEAQESPDSYEVPEEDKQAVPAAPSVRRLAREMGVNLQEVAGSGISGRISAEDVKRYAEDGTTKEQAQDSSEQKQPAQQPQGAPSAPPLPDFSKFGETSRESMSGIRKATVRSMSTAWSVVPMVTHFDKADITQFNAMRKKYQERAQREVGVKLTPTALLLKMVAGAVKKYPKFNASLDTENNEVVYKHYVNIGVAVDTEQGLLVPVIRDVDKKGIIQLAKDLDDMAEKARARKLGPDDMKGGNLSISNLGGIGGTNFTPIVNPPDVAIIGVSRGSVEPVWNKDKETFEPKMMMPMSVTYDHRLIDGADAARFMRLLCDIIEDPFLMSVEG